MKKKALQTTIPIAVLLGAFLLSTAEVSAVESPLNNGLIINNQLNKATDPLDVTVGWDIKFESSLPNIHVEDVFLEGRENESLHQKMVINNAANIGEATLHATKTIPMKKGHEYKINLIYAMQFNKTGVGSIDFNGDKVSSTDPDGNDAKDHMYTKTITPEKDMDYVITIDYKIPKVSNVYLKLAFDTKGEGGIVEKGDLKAPILEAPEANQKIITGTGQSGNTIEIQDESATVLGTSKVNTDGSFSVTAKRPFVYDETVKGVQITKEGIRSKETAVKVIDTIAPEAPTLEQVTNESKEVKGKAEANTLINLTMGSDTYQEHADSKGNFTIYLDKNYDFGTKVSATATDLAGNVSESTDMIVIYATELNVKFTDTISSVDTQVTGETTRGNVEVEIKINSRIFKVTSDENGQFIVDLTRSYPVGTKITAKVVDEYDQSKTAETLVTPRPPSLVSLREGDQLITGEADPNAKIEAIVHHGEEDYAFEVMTDKEGNYTIELKDDEDKPFKLKIGDSVEIKSVFEELGMESETIYQGIFSF
ncbi:Ig-like domain-containing protein [Enterococcus quebecensis]|uniref:Bacterial Ig domain-containing protein n=1 Tax=Enterococcus quebecensis TaxID=903983 RepID=A0A1E5GWP3_9ENTE|nr:Ig-like domain-containing protein [Enterococcus quebecensis]OEG17079.1 hypothetical protein BCR23_03470 [Enterococcus quebecensis]OJG75456.1 hypothetical protein RV12_GL001259 [Enterococcus quebecensis]